MTEWSKKLACRIVKNWPKFQENYIIVAPPMSAPERLFSLLGDSHFIKSILGDSSSTIAVANLSGASFSSEEKFVAALAKQWNVPLNSELEPVDQLCYLTGEIINSNRIPVLIIERFHEAMSRLGEDFGTELRKLDQGFKLRTVVELPISRKTLKLRWEADLEKTLFLNSNWGDLHSTETLKGYSLHEITNFVKERGGAPENAHFLMDATGGLPGLVDILIGRVGEMDVDSYELWVRSRAAELCGRLIDWLDNPGRFNYTRLVAQSLFTAHPHDGPISLTDHPWHSIIQGSDGKSCCKLLAWASIDHLAKHDAKYFTSLNVAAREGRRSEVLAQLEYLSNNINSNKETLKALHLLCKFHDAADPTDLGHWDKAVEYLSELKSLAERSENIQVKSIAQQLEKWDALTQFMSNFLSEMKIRPDEMLERFVCSEPDTEKKSVVFLELLNLRLKRACNLKPFDALKAVIEQPESLFQVYCQLKLAVCCWNYSGMDEAEASQIKITVKRPYTPPKKGGTLNFFDMLCLNLVKHDAIPQQDRLVLNDTEFHRFKMLYKDRSDQVHRTAFVSQSDWNEYYNHCRDLLGRVTNVLVGTNISIDLPEPMECFSQLAGSLVPFARS